MINRSKTVKKLSTFAVLESNGIDIVKYDVAEVRGFNDGVVMIYRKGEMVERVYVPRGYRYERFGGQFCVGKRIGNNSGCKLIEIKVDDEVREVQEAQGVVGESIDADCAGEDLSQLVGCDILGQAIRSIAVKKKFPVMALIVIVAIAIVAVLVLRNFVG